MNFVVFLAAIGCERLFELWLSARNAAWSRARGAIEVGVAHWPVMVALHLFFFVGPIAEVVVLHRPFSARLAAPMLALAVAVQVLRYWCICSLGRRWNVRVLVIPGAAAVVRGPYRYMRHPNYLAVVVEGICVPLVHGAYLSAAAFTGLNLVLLQHRIRLEQRALREVGTAYERVGRGGHAGPDGRPQAATDGT